MTRLQWIISQLTRRLWLHTSLIGALGVLAAILAAVVDSYLPWKIPGSISTDAIDSILTIIASSMLAVTTFSLSIMVSAYGSATSNVTPRATRLLTEDRLTQSVLSTFIGSFLFGIVGLIVLKTGFYGPQGRVVLFIFTIAVVALVVVYLLRWVDHLTGLGRVGETTARVEDITRAAIEAFLKQPYLGGRLLRSPASDIPSTALPVFGNAIGYVQHVDVPALSALSQTYRSQTFVKAVPGTFVFADTPLAWITAPETSAPEDSEGKADPEMWRQEIASAFSIGKVRMFDSDPRFGLAVMSEIACRALSPAINDPGTAIDVIGRSTRLLNIWASKWSDKSESEPKYPNVHIPTLDIADLFEDAFMAVARESAGMIEVQLRLQKSLLSLARIGDTEFKAAAVQQSILALARADQALTLEADKIRLREAIDMHAAPGVAHYR